MKTYELSLHGKQGDDLGFLLDKTKSCTGALREWATAFTERQAICEQIAVAIDAAAIDIEADGNFVFFRAKNSAAEKILAHLTRKKLLRVAPF